MDAELPKKKKKKRSASACAKYMSHLQHKPKKNISSMPAHTYIHQYSDCKLATLFYIITFIITCLVRVCTKRLDVFPPPSAACKQTFFPLSFSARKIKIRW